MFPGFYYVLENTARFQKGHFQDCNQNQPIRVDLICSSRHFRGEEPTWSTNVDVCIYLWKKVTQTHVGAIIKLTPGCSACVNTTTRHIIPSSGQFNVVRLEDVDHAEEYDASPASAAAAACRRPTCRPAPAGEWRPTAGLWRPGPCCPSSPRNTGPRQSLQKPGASTRLARQDRQRWDSRLQWKLQMEKKKNTAPNCSMNYISWA